MCYNNAKARFCANVNNLSKIGDCSALFFDINLANFVTRTPSLKEGICTNIRNKIY